MEEPRIKIVAPLEPEKKYLWELTMHIFPIEEANIYATFSDFIRRWDAIEKKPTVCAFCWSEPGAPNRNELVDALDGRAGNGDVLIVYYSDRVKEDCIHVGKDDHSKIRKWLEGQLTWLGHLPLHD